MNNAVLKKLVIAVVGLVGYVLGQEVELVIGFQPNSSGFHASQHFLRDTTPETDLLNGRILYARGFFVFGQILYEPMELDCEQVSWSMTLSNGSTIPMPYDSTAEGCPTNYFRPEQTNGNGALLPVSITLSYNHINQETNGDTEFIQTTVIIERPSRWPCGPNQHEADLNTVIATLEEDGTMTFAGTGIIRNMGSTGSDVFIPWRHSAFSIYNAIIESGISYIGYGVFEHLPNLTSVTIGALDDNSEIEIGGEMFRNNRSLKSVTCLYPIPPIVDMGGHYPHYDKSSVTLYVPESSISAYQSAPYWEDFKEVLPIPTASIRPRTPAPTASRTAPAVSITGKTLRISGVQQGVSLQVRMIDMRGKTVFSRNITGSAAISLSKVPAGAYVVKLRAGAQTLQERVVVY